MSDWQKMFWTLLLLILATAIGSIVANRRQEVKILDQQRQIEQSQHQIDQLNRTVMEMIRREANAPGWKTSTSSNYQDLSGLYMMYCADHSAHGAWLIQLENSNLAKLGEERPVYAQEVPDKVLISWPVGATRQLPPTKMEE